MVKRNKRHPFNAKSQVAGKYQDILNVSSAIEPTVPEFMETTPSGTSTPKEENQNTPKVKSKKGRRTKDKNIFNDFAKNPLTWGVISILISCVIWANNISHSIGDLEITTNKIENKFDQFSSNISLRLETIGQAVSYLLNSSHSQDEKNQINREFNLFNFSRNKSS